MTEINRIVQWIPSAAGVRACGREGCITGVDVGYDLGASREKNLA